MWDTVWSWVVNSNCCLTEWSWSTWSSASMICLKFAMPYLRPDRVPAGDGTLGEAITEKHIHQVYSPDFLTINKDVKVTFWGWCDMAGFILGLGTPQGGSGHIRTWGPWTPKVCGWVDFTGELKKHRLMRNKELCIGQTKGCDEMARNVTCEHKCNLSWDDCKKKSTSLSKSW